jgi:histidine ammonia-lyase
MREELELSHRTDITLEDVLRVGRGQTRVTLAPGTRACLIERRTQVETFVKTSGEAAYGFNRGFGHNVHVPVNSRDADRLQKNLILSHSCGLGEAAPVGVVRATMFLRAHSLARGHSGVGPAVVEALLDFLNHGITPVVPRLGTVSASGDLAPLSHIALGLLGQGRVTYRGQVMSARRALASAKMAPLKLGAKEGLALNNGVQYTAALAIHCVEMLERLLKTSAVITAVSTQVMLGADTPFMSKLHELRAHRGAIRVATWLWALMQNSPIREAHREFAIDGEVQDPYNLRCAPQILGACSELIQRARETLVVEMNSVTDNPLIFAATGQGAWAEKYGEEFLDQYVEIISGGHFHGMPLAVDMFGLLQAVAIMAQLSNVRCARYVDPHRNRGLGSDLKWPGPVSNRGDMSPAEKARWERAQSTWSGMMIPEYVSAGLTNWIWGSCMPSHLFSLSTDAGQEDHVSMAANVALRVLDNIPRLAEVLAMEFAFAAQAAAIRKEMDHIPSRAPDPTDPAGKRPKNIHHWTSAERALNPAGEDVLAEVRKVFPTVKRDRYMADELQNLATRILDGTILAAAEGAHRTMESRILFE